MGSSIGVAISTRNRRPVLLEALRHWAKHYDGHLVVVDDASDEEPRIEGVEVIRHQVRRGIPATKNAGIAALMDAGVEHLFLADDDTYPITDGWWQPYVDGAEPYYTYCWTHFAEDGAPVPKMDTVYQDSQLVAYAWSMGCLQYVHRTVIEAVGGLRLDFGIGFEEHAEWAQRIHDAGHTSFTHQDHPAATGRVWAGDEHYSVTRSFSDMDLRDRQQLIGRNAKLRESLKGSTDFVNYRA